MLTNFKNVLNECHIYVMKNDSIKKLFVIQKEFKNIISFIVFFFISLFSIDDFADLNFQINFFKLVFVLNYLKKSIFSRVFEMVFFTNFQSSMMSQILKNSNYDRFLLFSSIKRQKAIFEMLIKLEKIVDRKTTSLKTFINFVKKKKRLMITMYSFIFMTIIHKYTKFMNEKKNNERSPQSEHAYNRKRMKKKKHFHECERLIGQICNQNSQNTHEFQNSDEKNRSNTQLSIDKFKTKNFNKC